MSQIEIAYRNLQISDLEPDTPTTLTVYEKWPAASSDASYCEATLPHNHAVFCCQPNRSQVQELLRQSLDSPNLPVFYKSFDHDETLKDCPASITVHFRKGQMGDKLTYCGSCQQPVIVSLTALQVEAFPEEYSQIVIDHYNQQRQKASSRSLDGETASPELVSV